MSSARPRGLLSRVFMGMTAVVVITSVFVLGGLLGPRIVAAIRHDDGAMTVDQRVTTSISFAQDITLLKLRMQGIDMEDNGGVRLFDWKIPGTSKTLYTEYSYTALLGIDGREVTIRRTGEKSYELKIPPFTVLGNSDPEFRTAVEDNGIISFVTPDIDVNEANTRIMSEKASAELLSENRTLLEDQARTFYSGIVHGIDSSVTVTFNFDG